MTTDGFKMVRAMKLPDTDNAMVDMGATLELRMKTERKYPKPTAFVFYIMIPFSNIKKMSISIGFTTIFNHFLYSLIAKM
jgi:hypothetical protein